MFGYLGCRLGVECVSTGRLDLVTLRGMRVGGKRMNDSDLLSAEKNGDVQRGREELVKE